MLQNVMSELVEQDPGEPRKPTGPREPKKPKDADDKKGKLQQKQQRKQSSKRSDKKREVRKQAKKDQSASEKARKTKEKKKRERMQKALAQNKKERQKARARRKAQSKERDREGGGTKGKKRDGDPASKVPAQVQHVMLALKHKRGKSTKAAWNIARWSLTKHGYLKGPYRVNTKLPKAVKQTSKGVRRSFQHGMEKGPLNKGIPGTGKTKFRKFKAMFKDIEKDVTPKGS